MFARGAIWAPMLTLMNYNVDNISKYVCLTVIIDITRKMIKFFLMRNDDVITVMSHHFLMRVLSYLRYINIHILLNFSILSPKMAEL